MYNSFLRKILFIHESFYVKVLYIYVLYTVNGTVFIWLISEDVFAYPKRILVALFPE